ncbi:MAG: wax ester/triacylglycerol synthase domain-containing protein [Solirubrobacteraceae bacterium]
MGGPYFKLDYHVRRTALPSPGGHQELRSLVGRVMPQQLDRNKPVWELRVAEGLENGGWTLIAKAHHCMVDGVSATDLLSVILDDQREPEPPEPDDWTPMPEPSQVEFLSHSLAIRAASPYELTRTALLVVRGRGPRRAARQAAVAARGVVNLRSLLNPDRYSTINGPIGPHRRWSWARARVAEVKEDPRAPRRNRELCRARRDYQRLPRAAAQPPRRLRGVALRPAAARRPLSRVDGLKADDPDACARLCPGGERARHVQQQGFGDVRRAAGLARRLINTVTTIVSGPQHPLFLVGRRMLEAFPFVPLGGHVRVGVAILSYDGGINFGVTDSAPDIGVLCEGIEQGMQDLRGGPAAPPDIRPARPGAKAAL